MYAVYTEFVVAVGMLRKKKSIFKAETISKQTVYSQVLSYGRVSGLRECYPILVFISKLKGSRRTNKRSMTRAEM